MSVVKLTKSKKAVMFVDDDGNAFFTSVNFFVGLLNGKSDFLLLKRLPNKISDKRFKKSELWDPEGVFKNVDSRSLTTANDALSSGVLREKEEVKGFEDKQVWQMKCIYPDCENCEYVKAYGCEENEEE